MSKLSKLQGLLVLTDPQNKILFKSCNLVLKQGYDAIIQSFLGINPVLAPNTVPKNEPFLSQIKCGNGAGSVAFEDTALSGVIQLVLNIDTVAYSIVGGQPVVESQFVIPAGSPMVGTSLSEVALFAPSGGLVSATGLLFSRIIVAPSIPITETTEIHGHYYLTTMNMDEMKVFDSTFDDSFE